MVLIERLIKRIIGKHAEIKRDEDLKSIEDFIFSSYRENVNFYVTVGYNAKTFCLNGNKPIVIVHNNLFSNVCLYTDFNSQNCEDDNIIINNLYSLFTDVSYHLALSNDNLPYAIKSRLVQIEKKILYQFKPLEIAERNYLSYNFFKFLPIFHELGHVIIHPSIHEIFRGFITKEKIENAIFENLNNPVHKYTSRHSDFVKKELNNPKFILNLNSIVSECLADLNSLIFLLDYLQHIEQKVFKIEDFLYIAWSYLDILFCYSYLDESTKLTLKQTRENIPHINLFFNPILHKVRSDFFYSSILNIFSYHTKIDTDFLHSNFGKNRNMKLSINIRKAKDKVVLDFINDKRRLGEILKNMNSEMMDSEMFLEIHSILPKDNNLFDFVIWDFEDKI